MKLIFLLTITLFTNIVHAQGQSKTDSKPSSDIFKIITAPTSNQGKIEIRQNQQISDLVNRYIDSRKKDNTIPGYRILIYKSSGQTARAEANRTREKFISLFPDILAYPVCHEAPDFKVYVGDFRNENEVFIAIKKISKDFKRAYKVPARINLPKL